MELKWAKQAGDAKRGEGLNRTFYGIEIDKELENLVYTGVLIVPFMELKFDNSVFLAVVLWS